MSAGDSKNIASGLGVAHDGVSRTGSTVPSPPAQPRTSSGSRPVLSARSTGPANAGISASGPLVASVLGSYGYRAASPGPQRATSTVSQQHSSTHRSSSASMQRAPSSRQRAASGGSSKPIFAAYGLQYSGSGRTSGAAPGSAGQTRAPTATSPYRTRPSSSTGPPTAGMVVAAAVAGRPSTSQAPQRPAGENWFGNTKLSVTLPSYPATEAQAARNAHDLGHLLSVFTPTTPGGVPAGIKAPSSFRASKYAGAGGPSHKEAWGSSGGAPEPPGASGGGGGFPRPASAASSTASGAQAKPMAAQYAGDGRHSANLSLLRLQQQQQGAYGAPGAAGAPGMGAAGLPLAAQVQYQQQLLLQQQQLYQQQQQQQQQLLLLQQQQQAAGSAYPHTTYITFQPPPGGGSAAGGAHAQQQQRPSATQAGILLQPTTSKELAPGPSLPAPPGAALQSSPAAMYGGVQHYQPHQPSAGGMPRPWESGSAAAVVAAAAAQHAHHAGGPGYGGGGAASSSAGGLNASLGGPPTRLSSGSLPAAPGLAGLLPSPHLLPYVSVHDSVDGAPNAAGGSASGGYSGRSSVSAVPQVQAQAQPYGSTMPSLAPPPAAAAAHAYASTAPASLSFSAAMASAASAALHGLAPTATSAAQAPAAPSAPAPGAQPLQPPLPSLTPAPQSERVHLHHHHHNHNHPYSSGNPAAPSAGALPTPAITTPRGLRDAPAATTTTTTTSLAATSGPDAAPSSQLPPAQPYAAAAAAPSLPFPAATSVSASAAAAVLSSLRASSLANAPHPVGLPPPSPIKAAAPPAGPGPGPRGVYMRSNSSRSSNGSAAEQPYGGGGAAVQDGEEPAAQQPGGGSGAQQQQQAQQMQQQVQKQQLQQQQVQQQMQQQPAAAAPAPQTPTRAGGGSAAVDDGAPASRTAPPSPGYGAGGAVHVSWNVMGGGGGGGGAAQGSAPGTPTRGYASAPSYTEAAARRASTGSQLIAGMVGGGGGGGSGGAFDVGSPFARGAEGYSRSLVEHGTLTCVRPSTVPSNYAADSQPDLNMYADLGAAPSPGSGSEAVAPGGYGGGGGYGGAGAAAAAVEAPPWTPGGGAGGGGGPSLSWRRSAEGMEPLQQPQQQPQQQPGAGAAASGGAGAGSAAAAAQGQGYGREGVVGGLASGPQGQAAAPAPALSLLQQLLHHQQQHHQAAGSAGSAGVGGAAAAGSQAGSYAMTAREPGAWGGRSRDSTPTRSQPQATSASGVPQQQQPGGAPDAVAAAGAAVAAAASAAIAVQQAVLAAAEAASSSSAAGARQGSGGGGAAAAAGARVSASGTAAVGSAVPLPADQPLRPRPAASIAASAYGTAEAAAAVEGGSGRHRSPPPHTASASAARPPSPAPASASPAAPAPAAAPGLAAAQGAAHSAAASGSPAASSAAGSAGSAASASSSGGATSSSASSTGAGAAAPSSSSSAAAGAAAPHAAPGRRPSSVLPRFNPVALLGSEPDPTFGSLLPGYSVGKVIGEGGFCQVRLAVHHISQRKVAVKVIDRAKLVDPNEAKRMQREIRVMKHLSHQCVIKLFEVVESPRHLFLVMEHAPAGSLLDYVRARKRLPEADAAVFFQQIVASLEYCHSREVVHRDIKLENILLDADQRMKLIDFGLSAFFVPSKRLRVHCGSPSYAAPEIVARKAYEGPPVDVWSLGVVLFAMVAGYLPFHASGGNKQELCNKIMAGQYTAPDWLSASMKDLLARMLTTDPDKRITFQQVWQHSWVRAGPQWHERGVNCYEVSIDPAAPGGLRADEQVVSELEAAGYPRATLAQHLATGEATHLTASYFLLCEAKADAIRRLRAAGGRGGGSAGSLRSAPGSFTVGGVVGSPAGVGGGGAGAAAPGSAAVLAAAAAKARAAAAGESPGRPGSSRPTTARDGHLRMAVVV